PPVWPYHRLGHTRWAPAVDPAPSDDDLPAGAGPSRGGIHDQIVAVVTGGAVEHSAAGDERQAGAAGRGPDALARQGPLRMLRETLDHEGRRRTVVAMDEDALARLECAEVVEDV